MQGFDSSSSPAFLHCWRRNAARLLWFLFVGSGPCGCKKSTLFRSRFDGGGPCSCMFPKQGVGGWPEQRMLSLGAVPPPSAHWAVVLVPSASPVTVGPGVTCTAVTCVRTGTALRGHKVYVCGLWVTWAPLATTTPARQHGECATEGCHRRSSVPRVTSSG